MVQKIKTHWKEILIGFLVLFGMNKCTSSCTNNSRANKAEVACDSLKQVVDSQNTVIINLCRDTTYYLNSLRLHKDFEGKLQAKDSVNNQLVQKNNEVTQRNSNLSRQNRNLQNQLNNK